MLDKVRLLVLIDGLIFLYQLYNIDVSRQSGLNSIRLELRVDKEILPEIKQ